MKLVSIETIPGQNFETLDVVKGTVVYSKNFGRDFMAGMKTLVGGEIVGYTEMLNEARQIATKRMVDAAEALGADAVVGMRYASSSVMQGAAEVIAYGTDVYKRQVSGTPTIPKRWLSPSRRSAAAYSTLFFRWGKGWL